MRFSLHSPASKWAQGAGWCKQCGLGCTERAGKQSAGCAWQIGLLDRGAWHLHAFHTPQPHQHTHQAVNAVKNHVRSACCKVPAKCGRQSSDGTSAVGAQQADGGEEWSGADRRTGGKQRRRGGAAASCWAARPHRSARHSLFMLFAPYRTPRTSRSGLPTTCNPVPIDEGRRTLDARCRRTKLTCLAGMCSMLHLRQPKRDLPPAPRPPLVQRPALFAEPSLHS